MATDRTVRLLRRLADGLIGLSAGLAALGLLFQLVIVVVDVVGRALGQPLYGSQDLNGMAMIVIVFGGMALCDRTGGHVGVDLLEPRFSPALNRAIDIAAALLGASVFGALAWTTMQSAALSQMLGLSTNLLNLPKAWFQHAVSLFCAIAALGMLVRAAELAFAGRDIRTEGWHE